MCFVTNNLLAFNRKMADIAATGTDNRSVTLLSIFNTRSVRAIAGSTRAAKSHGFYSNLLAIAVDNVSRNNITTIFKQIASARNACCVGF